MPFRQENATCGYTVVDQAMNQFFCSLLTALVLVDIEDDIDSLVAFTELAELSVVQMRAQRAGHVAKARLPEGVLISV